jgi:S-adenosylmethionine synthetase
MAQKKVLKQELENLLRMKVYSALTNLTAEEEIEDFLRMKFFTELTLIKEKLSLFEKKYNSDFSHFETSVKNAQEEDFEQWDDYMEWKAFHNKYNELQERSHRL